MTAAKRLAALEAALVPQPDTYKPVDLRPVLAGIQIAIIAGHDGRKRKNESELTAFARALKLTPMRLFNLAYRDRKRFRARLAPLIAGYPRGPEFADDVADEIVRHYLVEELTHQFIELAAAAGWHPPARMPLCKFRPCRPADYRVPTWQDLCFAE